MIALGIDIGITGALAAVRADQLLALEDMPTQEKPGKGMTKREIDARALYELVLRVCGEWKDEAVAVCLENVHSIGPKTSNGVRQGSAGGFAFGDTRGAIRAVFEVMRLRPQWVAPIVWKRRYDLVTPKGEKVDKNKARLKALELYPTAPLQLAKHHNRAEALLVARFCWDRNA